MEEQEPLEDLIVIHPHLLQKFMRHGKDFANLLALYTFYTYHAKLQKTNQPLATDEFTRRGMNWASDRVKKTKRLLKKMNLITVIQKGFYYYIQLPFIYTKKRVGELLGNCVESVKASKKEELIPKKEVLVPEKTEKLLLNCVESLKTSKIEELPAKKEAVIPKEENLPSSKMEEDLDNCVESIIASKTEALPEDKEKIIPKKENLPVKKVEKVKKEVLPSLKIWLEYCNKKEIKYAQSNIQYWEKKLKESVSIDQYGAIYNAMNKGWKDFYLISNKASKYHKFLGKSLMLEKDCDTLLDISFKNKRYYYTFKNRIISSKVEPKKLFQRHGYNRQEVKKAPIVAEMKVKIMGLIKRF